MPPRHAEVDEAAGEVVGRDADDEADPEAGHFEAGERPTVRRRGSEVVVDEGRVGLRFMEERTRIRV